MPQNGMPFKMAKPGDQFAEIIGMVVYARDNEMPAENWRIYIQEAIIQLATECQLLAIGQSNMAGHLQDHMAAKDHGANNGKL